MNIGHVPDNTHLFRPRAGKQYTFIQATCRTIYIYLGHVPDNIHLYRPRAGQHTFI
jgi:hypothetical protein